MLDDNIPLERAKRFKQLRALCKLTKLELAEKIGCSPMSPSAWEKGFHGGINEKAAEKIVNAIKNIVECETEWLLSGEGKPPKLVG